MYLTNKQRRKIRLLTGAYIAIGAISLLAFIVFGPYNEDLTLLILGLLMLLLSPVIYKVGRYGEGQAKLINKGNKLVLGQLRPAEFLQIYEETRNNPDNVVAEPKFDVLQMVLLAYDVLGKTEEALDTLALMATVVPEKKRHLLKGLQASLLYANGKVEQAEKLYTELLNTKLDIMAAAVMNALTNADRAMARGDFATAEAYFNRTLTQAFPKPNPLGVVQTHFNLATIYLKTDRTEEAKTHLDYCIAHGGETFFQSQAQTLRNHLS